MMPSDLWEHSVDIGGHHVPSFAGVGAAFAAIYGVSAKFVTDQSDYV
jgi:hypothetical protein